MHPRAAEARRMYDDGYSLRDIGEMKYEEWGYPTANACAQSMRAYWLKAGLRLRSPAEASRLAMGARRPQGAGRPPEAEAPFTREVFLGDLAKASRRTTL